MLGFSDWRQAPTVNVDQLLTWVVLRDASAVQKVQGDLGGSVLISGLETASSPRLNLGDGLAEVKRRLVSGELTCTARRVGLDGRRLPVELHEWQSLEFNLGTGGAYDSAARIELAYLRFPTEQAIKIWPATDMPNSPEGRTASFAPLPPWKNNRAAAINAWATQNWGPDFKKLPNRKDILKAGRTMYGHEFNEDDARTVRRELAPDHQKAGGGGMHRTKLAGKIPT